MLKIRFFVKYSPRSQRKICAKNKETQYIKESSELKKIKHETLAWERCKLKFKNIKNMKAINTTLFGQEQKDRG